MIHAVAEVHARVNPCVFLRACVCICVRVRVCVRVRACVCVGPSIPSTDVRTDALTRPKGLCAEGFTLCPDQSKQTETIATVATSVNVPFGNMIGTDTLQLTGKPSFAKTPWDAFKYRKVIGKVCKQRPKNTRVSYRAPAVAGIDHPWSGNAQVWDFTDNEVRDVVEACSSSHPEMCTGFSWKGRMEGDGGGVNHTIMTPYTSARTYSYAGE